MSSADHRQTTQEQANMIERLQRALEHIEQLSPEAQEELARVILARAI